MKANRKNGVNVFVLFIMHVVICVMERRLMSKCIFENRIVVVKYCMVLIIFIIFMVSHSSLVFVLEMLGLGL